MFCQTCQIQRLDKSSLGNLSQKSKCDNLVLVKCHKRSNWACRSWTIVPENGFGPILFWDVGRERADLAWDLLGAGQIGADPACQTALYFFWVALLAISSLGST